MAECPKCGGGSFLVDEELVQVLENTDPVKILIKSIYQCRACSDRFSRLVSDSLDARKKQAEAPAPAGVQAQSSASSGEASRSTAYSDIPEGVKFF